MAVTDREILAAYRRVAREGLFAEPASAASVAGLLRLRAERTAARRRHGGLHPDRPRPEGPRVGDLGSGAPRRGARRPGRGRRRARPVGAIGSHPMRCTVRVPATSANLGPGFDCFGLALDLCNEVTIDTEAEPGVQLGGRGCRRAPHRRLGPHQPHDRARGFVPRDDGAAAAADRGEPDPARARPRLVLGRSGGGRGAGLAAVRPVDRRSQHHEGTRSVLGVRACRPDRGAPRQRGAGGVRRVHDRDARRVSSRRLDPHPASAPRGPGP